MEINTCEKDENERVKENLYDENIVDTQIDNTDKVQIENGVKIDKVFESNCDDKYIDASVESEGVGFENEENGEENDSNDDSYHNSPRCSDSASYYEEMEYAAQSSDIEDYYDDDDSVIVKSDEESTDELEPFKLRTETEIFEMTLIRTTTFKEDRAVMQTYRVEKDY